jgi:uncharacterized protein (TIGR04255 family)
MSDKILPFTKDHAIKEMSFALEFSDELGETLIRELFERHSEFESELPRNQKIQSVKFSFNAKFGTGDASGATTAMPSEYGGLVFDKLMSDGRKALSLNVNQQFISVTVGEYLRWQPTFEKAVNLLKLASSGELGKQNVSVIGLQYLDEFKFDGDPAEFKTEHLFATDTINLPRKCFDQPAPWHCHQGWLTKNSDGLSAQFIDNVNVDLGITNGNSLSILVSMTHREFLRAPTTFADLIFTAGSSSMVPVYEYMHKRNKAYLNDLLTPVIAERIGLSAS